MSYTIGDIVRFKVGSSELELGEVQFIEQTHTEDILYINGFGGWAYKVSEKNIVAPISKKTDFVSKLNKLYLPKGSGTLSGRNECFSPS